MKSIINWKKAIALLTPFFIWTPAVLVTVFLGYSRFQNGELDLSQNKLLMMVVLIISFFAISIFYIANYPFELNVELSDKEIIKSKITGKQKVIAWDEITLIRLASLGIRIHAGTKTIKIYPNYYKNEKEIRDYIQKYLPDDLVLPKNDTGE